jgi:two-component system, NarL family, nitrate/nitrite response regulator NarL
MRTTTLTASIEKRQIGEVIQFGSRSPFHLTRREVEIIETIVAGYSKKDIAQKLLISEQTVKRHLANIFDKLGVSNRLELALFAVHHQLIQSPR